ncbi:bud emergence protein 1 [Entomortierella beljakovae]|nr:bud emergence protein 1 [Entomortierella beljakovae]
MPNLRRSLQNKNNAGGLSPTRNHAAPAQEPPRKVIKALYNFKTTQPEELPFAKGDFFHVIGNEDDEDWYEACNPVTGARGFVPVTYFQTLEKSGQQQLPRGQQRNSNQSFDDNGNDSGTFMESISNQQYYSQMLAQQQQQHYPQQFIQHGNSYSNSGVQPGGMVTSVPGGPTSTSPSMSQKSASSGTSRYQPLYGIVLYDFGAERPDELDCKAGDAILVIAQSNEDWYVAKPIGRLGGPGLIPVNFIEVRDMVSGKPINVPEMLRQTGIVIPRVDEWKRQEMEYKLNSISLGRIDTAANVSPNQNRAPQLNQPPTHQPVLMSAPIPQIHQQQQQHTRTDFKGSNNRDQGSRRNLSQDLDIGRRQEGSNGRAPAKAHSHDVYEEQLGNRHLHNRSFSTPNPGSRIVNATVESFHYEDGQYWYSVRVELASGATRNLFRLYEDFYNFHIALLEEFPVESGRVGDQPRILPFMPIPLSVVTDTVSASRRTDLDGYVQDLCRLPPRITQHPLVEQLFAVKDGGDSESPPGAVAAKRPDSPTQGRSNMSRELDHRASPALSAIVTGGQRSGSIPRPSQGAATQGAANHGSRIHSDEPISITHSPGSRSQAQFPQPSSSSTEEMIKVKISYQDDIMAMRVPVAISFSSLQQKVFDRLQVQGKNMSYRDDRGDFAIIQSDKEIYDAIDQSGGKLMIYVD